VKPSSSHGQAPRWNPLQNVAIGVTDIPALLSFAQSEKIDLTIVAGSAAGEAWRMRSARRAENLRANERQPLEGSKPSPKIPRVITSRRRNIRTSPKWSLRWFREKRADRY
jgi:phosphoribosylamine--glycine ligase